MLNSNYIRFYIIAGTFSTLQVAGKREPVKRTHIRLGNEKGKTYILEWKRVDLGIAAATS